MLTYTKSQVQAKIDANFKDNVTGFVTPALAREVSEYLKNLESLASETKYTNSNKPSYTLLSQFMDYLMGNNIPIWANDQYYPAGYFVSHSGILYRTKVVISPGGDEPLVSINYDPVQPLFSIPTFDDAKDYPAGFITQYNNKLYKAKADVGGGEDPPSELVYWDRIGIFNDEDINELATIQDLVLKNNMTEVAISALNIDWSLGKYFTKTITEPKTFTFSNVVVGKTIIVEVTGGYEITWPTGKLVNGTRDSALTYYHVTCLKTGKYLIETKTYA